MRGLFNLAWVLTQWLVGILIAWAFVMAVVKGILTLFGWFFL